MKKLAIITTHPIQYNAPFFKLLTERGKVQLKVFYTWPQAIEGFDDPDFGRKVQWDIPLLEGYDWRTVDNISKHPSSKSWKGINCPNLILKIEEFDPDAVMIYGWNFKSHFDAMRYFKGKREVWFFGDSTLLDEKPGIKKMIRRIWLTLVYRYTDRAFYVGTNNKAYFKAHGFQDEQLAFFPHAIDNTRFKDDDEGKYKEKARELRQKLGYQIGDFVVLYAGKFEPRKDLHFLIKSILNINQQKQVPIHLLLAGDGPLFRELFDLANGSPFIRFIPFQNQLDMPVIYRIGDIFCLPSQSETWGLSVNEAMACGRPVLLNEKVGCAVDLVEDNFNGRVFRNNSSHHLEMVIKELAKSDLTKLGLNSSEKVEEFTFEKKCIAVENSI